MADAERFRAYSADLSTNADLAAATVRRIVDATRGMTDAEAYEFVRRNYPKAVRAYGIIAAERARAYYQAERDDADLDQEYTATSGGGGDQSWYAQDVDEAQGGGTGDHALVSLDGLAGRAVQRVMARADRTIGLNAHRDPAHPKWAVVPHPGACGFCVMVASNGWGYDSKASALAQRHENCKCVVAVDFSDSPSLDGYDPGAMRDAYAACEKAVHDDVERQWEAMPDEERARYVRKGRSAKDVYKAKRVCAEMDRRDRAWLQDPKTRCGLTREPGARPLKKELDVAEHLVDKGFNVRFIKETNKSHVKTPDAYLNDEVWEFKVPEGWNDKTVKNQFKKAVGKGTGRLLISCTENKADGADVCAKVASVLASDEYPEIRDVIVMDSDGEHITRLGRH